MRNISFHWLLLFLLGALFSVSCSKEPLLQNGEEVTEEPATNDPENISKKPSQKVSLHRRYKHWRRRESRFFLHCNWGWGGYDNGYFLEGVFDTKRPIRREQNISSSQWYYQYNVSNITNIHR